MPATTQPVEAAEAAGLRYVDEAEPGIERRRRGRGFSYARQGRALASARARARIDALAIPPAWRDVWICIDEHGHIQATGRDEAGRKQYRYHDQWQVLRDLDKFEQLATFGRRLPKVRRRVAADLARRGLPRERVLALVVRLLDETLIRVGNPQYAERESFGLTTLRSRHVDIDGASVAFEFDGKSGVPQEIEVADRQLATLIRRCDEQGGDQLFVYPDADRLVEVRSDDVNEYLRTVGGSTMTARDFRTWGGTVAVVRELGPKSGRNADDRVDGDVLAAIDRAAELLGNTRTVCRGSYVHPAVAEAYLDGTLADAWQRSRRSSVMSREERATLRVLPH